AEGNPLFLEETARMLAVDEGVVLKRIPDSIQALIAARIDALEGADKRLLQRAALVGRVFWRGALDALSPGADVAAGLDRLLERARVQAGGRWAAPASRSRAPGSSVRSSSNRRSGGGTSQHRQRGVSRTCRPLGARRNRCSRTRAASTRATSKGARSCCSPS